MSATKFLLAALVLVTGFGSSEAFAQRDAGAKIRGEFGTGFYSRSRSSTRSYRYAPPTYARSVAPSMVAPATPEMAGAPTARRAFSYEPSVEPAAPAVSPSPRYYESTPRYYSTPRSRRSSRIPTYFLPKTDPRRFGG